MSDFSPNDRLQLSREEMRQLGYQVVDMLVDHFDSLPEQPVTGRADRPTLETRLREPLPEQGSDPQTVLQQLRRDVFSYTMRVDHPRFFAFIPLPGNFVSAMADALAAGYQTFVGTWFAGSGPAQIELVVIDWLREFCGLPKSAGGLFVSGGSMANLIALAAARHVRLENDMRDAVIYFSDQTHHASTRGLRILGFGSHQLRSLASDENFRLSLDELKRAVATDREARKRPFCVVANAGTTNTGAVDPLDELADFCEAENLWLHADGAYGAAAMLTEKGRAALKGLERAHSLALDPHKWLFQSVESGCVLVRDSQWLKDTFYDIPEYMKDVERGMEEINFANYGPQLTRSFRALKLWLSFKVFGAAAFRRAITRGFEMAELAESLLHSSPRWEVVTPAQMGIVTFRYLPEAGGAAKADLITERLVEKQVADGFALATGTQLHGRAALRLCTPNPRTTTADIRQTIQRLEQLAAELSREIDAQTAD